jgi:hypothetical protein
LERKRKKITRSLLEEEAVEVTGAPLRGFKASKPPDFEELVLLLTVAVAGRAEGKAVDEEEEPDPERR